MAYNQKIMDFEQIVTAKFPLHKFLVLRGLPDPSASICSGQIFEFLPCRGFLTNITPMPPDVYSLSQSGN